MSENLDRQSRAPGAALRDAAPGPTIFTGFGSGSPTGSDAAGPMPSTPGFLVQPQQQQQPRTPSVPALPLTGTTSSYSFSFCGSDAFGVNDAVGSEPQPALTIPAPPPPHQQPQAHQHYPIRHYPSAPDISNAAAFSPTTAVPPPPTTSTDTTATSTLNTVSLAAVNMDYFYGIPTPSAPPRTPHSASNASNCSSSHHQATTSGESSAHGSSAPTHRSIGEPQPPPQVPQQPGGMQKDVLAFMAAEQQQQKFVLQQRNVYMSGLPVDFRPSAFRAMCEVFGRIESSKLCMEADDANRCRGFGFVLYFDVESATSCIASLNGKVMQGKTLQVRRADLSAAPQPLNPVTQRNRSGSSLVTPPSVPQLSSGSPTTASAYPMFSPHPPPSGLNNTVASPLVVSNLPFTFATPTMLGVPPTNMSNSSNPPPNAAVTPLKGSANGSSFLYGGPSASSSMGTSSNPPLVYTQGATMVPAMRNGVPIMQMYAPCPPPGPNNMQAAQQQQQQQPQLVSMPSGSRSDVATSHSATPCSVGSSTANMQFVPAPSFQPQPPMSPQSPVTFYRHSLDGQAQPTFVTGGNANTNNSFYNGGMAVPPPQQQNVAQMQNMYAPNLLMQEYLAASGLDPNASNSNIYYLFPH